MTAILEREHFTVSQENKYFSLESLSKMIGQEPNQWRHAALKELIDNSLDAAESVYPAITPNILIEFTETENGLILSVADNGPGIAADKIPQIADFTANSSTKLFYRAPLRGAQGNALKTLIGIPVALGQERGHLDIETRDWRHSLQAWLTPVGVRKDHQQTEIETTGTRLTATIPGPLDCYYWEPARWIIAYSLFNPHATLQIRKIDPVWSACEENDDGQRAHTRIFRICHCRQPSLSLILGVSFCRLTRRPPTGIAPANSSNWSMPRLTGTRIRPLATSFRSSKDYPASGGRSPKRSMPRP